MPPGKDIVLLRRSKGHGGPEIAGCRILADEKFHKNQLMVLHWITARVVKQGDEGKALGSRRGGGYFLARHTA
jgi:hypothetical protein